MKVAFVDTLYFVALFNSRDQWHERAIAACKLVAETKLITTEDVLGGTLEFLFGGLVNDVFNLSRFRYVR